MILVVDPGHGGSDPGAVAASGWDIKNSAPWVDIGDYSSFGVATI